MLIRGLVVEAMVVEGNEELDPDPLMGTAAQNGLALAHPLPLLTTVLPATVPRQETFPLSPRNDHLAGVILVRYFRAMECGPLRGQVRRRVLIFITSPA